MRFMKENIKTTFDKNTKHIYTLSPEIKIGCTYTGCTYKRFRISLNTVRRVPSTRHPVYIIMMPGVVTSNGEKMPPVGFNWATLVIINVNNNYLTLIMGKSTLMYLTRRKLQKKNNIKFI